MKTIVVGLDGARAAGPVLERAALLAGAFDSKVIVVVVDEVVSTVPLSTIADAGVTPPAITDHTWSRELALEQARSYLGERKIVFEVLSPVGDAGTVISDVAEEHQADLIIVPGRNAGFFERWFLGNISDSVIRSAHRDVLLVADDNDNEELP